MGSKYYYALRGPTILVSILRIARIIGLSLLVSITVLLVLELGSKTYPVYSTMLILPQEDVSRAGGTGLVVVSRVEIIVEYLGFIDIDNGYWGSFIDYVEIGVRVIDPTYVGSYNVEIILETWDGTIVSRSSTQNIYIDTTTRYYNFTVQPRVEQDRVARVIILVETP